MPISSAQFCFPAGVPLPCPVLSCQVQGNPLMAFSPHLYFPT